MSLSFPSSPTSGQTSVQNGRTYVWNGSNAWELSTNVAGHAASHGSAGADPVTIASTQVTGLATVATSGSAADLSTGTLPDARLSGSVVTAATLSASLHASTSAYDLLDRRVLRIAASVTAQTVYWTFFSPPYSFTASQLSASNAGTASGLTLARLGLYTADSAGAVTLVARTASDTTLFSSANTVYTRSFATAGGYPATYSLTAGSRYAVALVMVGGSCGIVGGDAIYQVAQSSPRVVAQLTGQSDLPTSVASNGYSAGANSTIYWYRVS